MWELDLVFICHTLVKASRVIFRWLQGTARNTQGGLASHVQPRPRNTQGGRASHFPMGETVSRNQF